MPKRKQRNGMAFAPFAVAMLPFLAAPSPMAAQDAPVAARSTTPLSRYVPASAHLFVHVRKLADVDRAINRAHAWRALSVLSGSPVHEQAPLDLRRALTRFLGEDSTISLDDLMRAEIGVVIESWPDFNQAVWLARVPEEDVLERWFPRQRGAEAKQAPGIRFLRSEDGMVAAYRNGVLLMSRHTARPSLFRDALALMTGQRSDSLDQLREYQALLAYLPQRELATVYWAVGNENPAHPRSAPLPLLPDATRAVLRLFEGDGRIELAVRATRRSPQKQDEIGPDALERMVRLPQTTIFTAATRIDFTRMIDGAGDADGWTRHLVLLEGLLGPGATLKERLSLLGPHVIIAWEPDLHPERESPRAALMIECKDARMVDALIEQSVLNALKLATAMTRSSPEEWAVKQTTRLGVTIHSLPPSPRFEHRDGPLASMLADAEPAWAIWGHWLIVALHREQIERIIDAHYGLIPPLVSLPDVLTPYRERAERSVFAIAQPGLAADVVDEWLKKLETGSASFLDPSSWSGGGRSERAAGGQLGIGMKANQRPGMVVIARVYPDSTAAGLLEPGDRIIGIDGQLLALTSPNVDLRRRWLSSTAEPGPTLRIMRGEDTKDVVVTKSRPANALPPLLMNPARALRELSEIGHTLQLTSFALNATDPQHYSARLSLRFAPPAAGATAAAGAAPSAKPNSPARQERPSRE